MNKTKDLQGENAVLLEGSHSKQRTTVYGRYEWVQKSTEELGFSDAVYGHDVLLPVQALTAGASYDVLNVGKTKIALGAQLTVYRPGDRLSNFYGKTPLAAEVYLRIYSNAVMSKMQ